METEIIKYLKDKYHPRVIALTGSRVGGKYKEDSDWDLFVFCQDKLAGGFFNWHSQLLDLTFHDWPKPKDWVFTTPYSPVWPVKVLLDDTQGKFDAILKRTKEIYDLGPLESYPAGYAERLQKLDRWFGKIQKHEKEPEVQFYYAGYIYEFLIRIWFEQQNLWPQPPAQAIPFIKEKDFEFWQLLHDFTNAKGSNLTFLTDKIIKRVGQILETTSRP